MFISSYRKEGRRALEGIGIFDYDKIPVINFLVHAKFIRTTDDVHNPHPHMLYGRGSIRTWPFYLN